MGEIRYLEKHTKRPPDLLFGVQELSPSFDEIPSDSPKESVRDVYLAITGCLDDDVEEIQSLGRTSPTVTGLISATSRRSARQCSDPGRWHPCEFQSKHVPRLLTTTFTDALDSLPAPSVALITMTIDGDVLSGTDK